MTATGMATEMGNGPGCSGRPRRSRPLQREVDRIGRALGIAVIVIALVVVTAIVLTSDLEDASDVVSVLLVGVSLAVAAVPEGCCRPVRRARARRAAHGQAAGDREAALVRGDARLGLGRLLGQDGNADEERDDDREGRHRLGRGRRHGQRLPARGRAPRRRPPARGSVLLDEVAVLVGEASRTTPLREEGRRVDDPGRSDRGRLPRRGGEGRGIARGARGPLRARRRGAVRRAQADEHGRARPRRRAGPRRRDQGRPDVLLARCTSERVAGEVHPLTGVRREDILTVVERLADQALRTLAVAYRPLPDGAGAQQDESLERSSSPRRRGSSTRRGRRRGRRSPRRPRPGSGC